MIINKELSIEEKARRYDEAIKRLEDIEAGKCQKTFVFTEGLFGYIFPELKESEDEDERIRKELIKFVKVNIPDEERYIAWLEKQKTSEEAMQYLKENHSPSEVSDFQAAMNIAVAKAYDKGMKDGLKKQGAKVSAIEGFESEFERQVSDLIASAINKEHEYNQGYVKWTANALLNYAKHELEKQDEQKSADKVEPKFKIGDWIVFNGLILYIKDIVMGFYRTISIDGIPNSYDWSIDNAARLWTIEDAKEGDVLINTNVKYPFIFKEIKPSNIKTDIPNPLTVFGYCGIGGTGFTKSSGWGDTVNCIYYPAAKEQRDLLFQNMKESGYEWDTVKKELKKIEQKSTALSEEDKEEVEYTRTDAFIEKACAKLKKLMYDSLMFQGRLHQEEIIERFIEDFKNHMKG